MNAQRSGCPINLTVEALGDRWSLIVIRDLMFGNRRHFRELTEASIALVPLLAPHGRLGSTSHARIERTLRTRENP